MVVFSFSLNWLGRCSWYSRGLGGGRGRDGGLVNVGFYFSKERGSEKMGLSSINRTEKKAGSRFLTDLFLKRVLGWGGKGGSNEAATMITMFMMMLKTMLKLTATTIVTRMMDIMLLMLKVWYFMTLL